MEVCGIKEAIQKLKRLELEDFGKKRKFDLKESEVAYITVLNELDKKDKVIDMMANELRDTCHFEYMSRKEVKEYFYNKIEIPEEN